MRIGMFSECYEPVRNGVTTSVHTLITHLRRRGHRVILVAPHYSAHRDQTPFVLRVPSMQTWLNKDYPIAYPFYGRLVRQFGRVSPDLVHSHNPFFVGLLAVRLAHQYNLPLVSTYHTLYNHYGHYIFFLPDPAVQGLLKWWIPEYYNRCHHVIAPSKVAKESLLQYGVTSPITVIPTAVPLPDPSEISPEARKAARSQWDIPEGCPLLLYVGRLAQEKNVELVLDSFSQISRRYPEARLLVVGGGPHLDALRRYAATLPASERIIFAGPMAHSELTPVYAAADLFVFASTTETQGLVMAEARAAGTPCVVARGGGASETVRHGEDGIVVEPSREAFAAAISELLDNPARLAAMREACHANARNHTPEAMTDAVLEVYRSVLSSNLVVTEEK
jgi:glycosyltransferase involved in cell wall biosynthesis